MANLETGDCMTVGRFEDDGTGLDPRTKAEALWESVKDDWPGWEVAYLLNDAAAELMKQRRMWSLGMSDEGDEMPARIEAHNASFSPGATP